MGFWCGVLLYGVVMLRPACLLAAGSRATRRFVRPLPSQGRLAANPREWFSAPPQAHAPKAPNESNQSIDSILGPCPARPTTAIHDACCCTLSAFWTRWARVGSRWPPPNSPPNFPCSSAWSLHGWWPATLCTSSRKIQQPPYGLALCQAERARRHRKVVLASNTKEPGSRPSLLTRPHPVRARFRTPSQSVPSHARRLPRQGPGRGLTTIAFLFLAHPLTCLHPKPRPLSALCLSLLLSLSLICDLLLYSQGPHHTLFFVCL